MLLWTEANASWSNRSAVATYKYADSTSLQLMGGDAEPGEAGRYYPGNPGLMALRTWGPRLHHPGPHP
jgi:hypothetical protein